MTLALAAGQEAASMSPAATASVDRPAMWVGDRVVYTVTLTCPRGIDILTDDLGRDKLKLTGLDVLSSDSFRQQDAEQTQYIFRYVLTSYRIDVPSPSVAPFSVRYYVARPGQPPERAAPAGSVAVPGATVIWRSLLPDDQPADVRDGRALPERWWPYRLMGPVGLGLIIGAVVPALLMALDTARRIRTRRGSQSRPSPRQARQAARASYTEIRALDPTSPEALREAFARLDAAIRLRVLDVCGVPAAGLTPQEIARAIEPCAARLPPQLVSDLLETCERARYSAPSGAASLDDWRAAVAQAEPLLV
jgi:hypothetical protein